MLNYIFLYFAAGIALTAGGIPLPKTFYFCKVDSLLLSEHLPQHMNYLFVMFIADWCSAFVYFFFHHRCCIVFVYFLQYLFIGITHFYSMMYFHS